jgi:phenylpyruvate tautomerase PptA (4-oxalocrotonate tautomerase family)
MPIVDVRPVVSASRKLPSGAAQMLADSIARVLGAETGRVWVLLAELQCGKYAENGAPVEGDDLPVFVQILHADWPEEAVRVKEAQEIAEAVASSLMRPVEQVHVEYAAPGRGRVAFGGKLVR